MKDKLDISLWYECNVARGMSKKDAEAIIRTFDALLSKRYKDFQIWRTLDREHLFPYISRIIKKRGPLLSDEPGLQGKIDEESRERPIKESWILIRS